MSKYYLDENTGFGNVNPTIKVVIVGITPYDTRTDTVTP